MRRHRLLERQLAKANKGDGRMDIDKLVELVDGAYVEYDRDHVRNERVNSLMVEEMEELNDNLAQALDKIKHRQEWFEAAMDNMVQGLSLYDSDGCLVVFNEKYASMFGLTVDQLQVGMNISDVRVLHVEAGLFYGEDAKSYIACHDLGKQSTHTNFVRKLANGRELEINCQPLARGGYLSTYEDITERLDVERQVRHMANHDSLTGLPNRFKIREHLQKVVDAAKATGSDVAVLYIDLDGFKDINDTLGHNAGDEVLKIMTERIVEAIDGTAVLGRLSGDEFMVIADKFEDAEALSQMAMQICSAASQPILISENWVSLTTGIGIALGSGANGNIETLISNADLALYRVKANGGAGFRFFESDMDAEARERRQLASDLRHALPEEQLMMFYQPLIDLSSGATAGYEALMRWEHPELGMIAPPRFIEIAEATGQISSIGEWALRTACAYAATWQNGEAISVNLSPLQFKYQDVASVVKSALDDTGLDPKRLELEITESVLIQNPDAVVEAFLQLNKIGVSLALDDFGTGFSSLSYLARFSFQKIKIDRSFIKELGHKPEITAIISSIIGLGRGLGTVITAEGIEEPFQHELLRAAGCTQGQGFLYGRPMPAVLDREVFEFRQAKVS